MIKWVILLILALVIIFVLKIKHFRHKFILVSMLVLLVFIYLSSSYVISSTNADLKSFDGVVGLGKAYIGWLGSFFENIKVLTGKAIGLDWRANKTAEKTDNWDIWEDE